MNKAEVEAAIHNLEYLLQIVPVVMEQHNHMVHAISLLKKIRDAYSS